MRHWVVGADVGTNASKMTVIPAKARESITYGKKDRHNGNPKAEHAGMHASVVTPQ